MTYYDIYLSALAFIGEAEDSTGMADYKKRAVLLLPHIVSSLAYISELLGKPLPNTSELMTISLDAKFPIDLRLSTAASAQLASLLIIDEIPEVSQALAKRAHEEKERVLSQYSSIGQTREVY